MNTLAEHSIELTQMVLNYLGAHEQVARLVCKLWRQLLPAKRYTVEQLWREAVENEWESLLEYLILNKVKGSEYALESIVTMNRPDLVKCIKYIGRLTRCNTGSALQIAAWNGYVKILKVLRVYCDTDTYQAAARGGQLDTLKWLYSHRYPYDRDDPAVVLDAAGYGHLEVLKWLHGTNFRWDYRVSTLAAYWGHLPVLEWLYSMDQLTLEDPCVHRQEWRSRPFEYNSKEPQDFNEAHKTSYWTSVTSAAAAQEGNLEVIEFLKKIGCPFNSYALTVATSLSVLQALPIEQIEWREWSYDTTELGYNIPEYSDGAYLAYGPYYNALKSNSIELLEWCDEHLSDWSPCSQFYCLYAWYRITEPSLWPSITTCLGRDTETTFSLNPQFRVIADKELLSHMRNWRVLTPAAEWLEEQIKLY